MRAATGVVAIVLVMAIAGCEPSTGGLGRPSRTPGATPAATGGAPATAPGPTAVPVGASEVKAAIEALERFHSYRFRIAQASAGQPAIETRGVVVNGPPRRMRMDQVLDGQVAMSAIRIASREWTSFGGGYVERTGDLAGEDWQGPVEGVIGDPITGVTTMVELGRETREGVAVRHLRGRASARMPGGGEGDFLISTFTGDVDAWIAVDGGRLVAARADGVQDFGAFLDEPTASPVPLVVEVTVDGVDDPANRVDEPPAAEPTPLATGDPAVIALIESIDEGLGRLTAYEITIESGFAGQAMTGTLTVVNRPVPAARMVYGGMAGFDGLSILVIGDEAWSRSGTQPWVRATGDSYPTCGTAGSVDSSSMQRCTFALMTDVAAQDRAIAGTFELVDAEELVGGVRAVHLRSDAGMTAGEMTVPGTTDLWIAADDGRLVRATFAGTGITSTMTVVRVDDPTLVLEPPGG